MRARIVSFAITAVLATAPHWVRAEVDDLHLRTLELLADARSARGLEVTAPIETLRWPLAKIRRAGGESPFDPRPGLRADAELYRALGLLPAGDEGDALIDAVPWPAIPASFLPAKRGGGRVVVAQGSSEAAKLAHGVAVNLAVLAARYDLSAAADIGNRDRQLAAEALYLGDATISAMARAKGFNRDDVEARHRWAQKQVTSMLSAGGVHVTRESFPARLVEARYRQGVEAALRLRATSPWGVVEQLYKRGVPRSTAQLLHPRALLEDRQNRELVPLALEALSARGEPVRGVFGELRLGLWLERFLSAEVARRAASGWAGDGYLLYPAAGETGPPLLVLLVAFDEVEEPAEAEARDFAGAVARAFEGMLGEGAARLEGLPPMTNGFADGQGRQLLVEQRDDKVLLLLHCPADRSASVREETWSTWRVGRPDLGVVGEIRAAPPAPIASLPPPEPWYRRTPGLVALLLWLLLLLPAASYGISRRTITSPIVIYLYGVLGTGVLIAIGWAVGL